MKQKSENKSIKKCTKSWIDRKRISFENQKACSDWVEFVQFVMIICILYMISEYINQFIISFLGKFVYILDLQYLNQIDEIKFVGMIRFHEKKPIQFSSLDQYKHEF